MKEVAAIILAAGKSRRMGAFKPLLPFGDSTVVESSIASLRGASVDEIVIVIGHRAEDVRAHLKESDVVFAINDDLESEMIVSIVRGAEALSQNAGAVLIALADHPAIDSKTIKKIINEWKRGAALVQPVHGGRGGHPVLIDLKFKDELFHLDQQTGLRGFFDNHRTEVCRLPVDCPFVARDMDTWEDYTRLHEDLFGRLPRLI